MTDASGVRQAELDGLLDSFRDLPTIPEVLTRIWEVVEDPRSSARDLEQVVMHEPPLAAKVLRLANSAYYGGRGRIEDLRTAITTLGFDTLRNLAVCLSVASRLAGKGGDSVLDHRELWRHSVATAVIARRIGRAVGAENPEELFTAGLLHDIGKFVISLGRPGAYAEIVRRSHDEELEKIEAEREVLGYDHAEVGAGFARRWNFPARLEELIGGHHDPASDDRSVAARVLAVADRLANDLAGEGLLLDGREEAPVVDELVALGLEPEAVGQLDPVLRADIDRAREFLNLI